MTRQYKFQLSTLFAEKMYVCLFCTLVKYVCFQLIEFNRWNSPVIWCIQTGLNSLIPSPFCMQNEKQNYVLASKNKTMNFASLLFHFFIKQIDLYECLNIGFIYNDKQTSLQHSNNIVEKHTQLCNTIKWNVFSPLNQNFCAFNIIALHEVKFIWI